LLRADAGDGFDQPFLQARLTEIRRILTDAETGVLGRPIELHTASTRTGYGLWADTYDDENNPLFEVESNVLRDLLADIPAGRALDAACGTGRHSAWLAERCHTVIGVDHTPEMLDRARNKGPAAEFVLGQLDALPVPDERFDVVVCSLALTHQPDLAPVLTEFARVLRPGGHLVTSDIHVVSLYLGGVAHVPGIWPRRRCLPAAS
jgi:SAM-dependent methyltransferase